MADKQTVDKVADPSEANEGDDEGKGEDANANGDKEDVTENEPVDALLEGEELLQNLAKEPEKEVLENQDEPEMSKEDEEHNEGEQKQEPQEESPQQLDEPDVKPSNDLAQEAEEQQDGTKQTEQNDSQQQPPEQKNEIDQEPVEAEKEEHKNEPAEQQPKENQTEQAEDENIETSPKVESSTQQNDMGTFNDSDSQVYKHQTASPEPEFQENATCTVKLMLMPSGQVHTMRCGLLQTLGELKEHFSKEIKVSPDILLFMFNGKAADNKYTLADIGVGPNGTVQLEITSTDPSTPLKPIRPKVEYQMPDVITVRVETESGELQDIVVEIERATRKKPFLGGYRHKETHTEFHHAAAQTMQKPKPPSAVERNCRDTQTFQQKHIVQQTTNNMSTQMTKIGVYVSNMEDKLVIPGKYTTADEYHSNIDTKVLCIQKYYRRWLAKRYVEKVRKDKAKREEWERKEELRKRKEKEDRIRKEFERRMNPKTKEDFDLLFNALEKWRQEELERINAELTGAERKAALCELLDQETQLIASIGRHKIDADTENRQKGIQAFLDKAAAPKKWKGRSGKPTEMDTPYTIRAQELRDIYNSINMKYLTQDERLDVLLTLKHTVKEHDCKLTQEIIELIDREADLLMRGVKETNLDGLRKRISTLFLQYIKTPTFNPEAARLLKVPQDPSVLRKDIYFCASCNQYKPSTEFQLSSNSKGVGRCQKCNKVDNDARLRQDYSHYRYMLKTLRRSEQAYGDGSQIAFLLQEADLRYLVENVWNNQSILSAWEDLYDLVLVRWDRHIEWSPWNCILITKEEAASHDKLENMDEAYGKPLIHKVQHKHTLARNYFSRLPGMAEHMRSQIASSSMVRGPSISGKSLSAAPAVGVHS